MRVLLHYTHKQTLGHTTRSISLAAAICRQGAELLILQGGVPQPFVRFPQGCRVADIPLPFDTRASFQSHVVPASAAQRSRFILKTAAEFAPDVFVTEFFPFGRLSYLPELLPTLRTLRKKGVRIMSSIGYPLLVDLDRLEDKKFTALHRAVFAFFDAFLIHTPPELETRYIQDSIQSAALSRAYAAFMKKLKKRTVYTGYIVPEKIIASGAGSPTEEFNGPNVIVSRGGGAVYPKLITSAIEAQRLLGDNIRTVITSGPATSPKERALFQSCLKPEDNGRVFLADLLPDLDDLLRTCRVSVSLCGYNTSVQLMRYGTPAVIVPYQNKNYDMATNDQIARARLLQEKFSSIVLDHDALTGPSLADAIKEQMNRPRPAPAPAEWFSGADVAAHLVVQGTPN
ncbi:MAG: glycosyltransferase [Candidatus Omnitrophota bacterium]|nr:glycosyltransferase [Candidatus Omnitrophota bacterium]MDZ4243127.1 glycosyltransferase [Candidatus Omnitrophota bacterium]